MIRPESASVGQVAPNARQEQGAPLASRDNEPVAVRLERSHELRFAFGRNRPWVGEDRHVKAKPCEFGLLQRRKAWVGKGRLRGIGDRIVDERPAGGERTDAAAKPFVFGQGDEGRAPRRKRGRTSGERRGRRLAAGLRSIAEGDHAGGKQTL